MRPRSRGFSLAELLVALAIGGIVLTVIFRLIMSQGEFTRRQGAVQEVQQNARFGLELLASELRSVPPTAITAADSDSIAFLLPRAWGVTCQPVTDLSTTLVVRFAQGTFPADFVPAKRRWGIAVGQTTDPAAPPPDWRAEDSVAVQSAPGSCGPLGAATPGSVAEIRFTGYDPSPFTSGAVPEGVAAFAYERVRYNVGNPDSRGQRWLQRSVGFRGPAWAPVSSQQGFAGPLAWPGGFALSYYSGDGTLLGPTPLSAPQRAAIARVRILVRTESQERFDAGRQTTEASTLVFLRN